MFFFSKIGLNFISYFDGAAVLVICNAFIAELTQLAFALICYL
jgi:hypothetical protein